MEVTGIIFLIGIGTMLLVIELFVLFGSFKIGILGLLANAIGIAGVYSVYGAKIGHITLGVIILIFFVLTIIAISIMSKREVGLTDTLAEAKVNIIDTYDVPVGITAIAQSDLKKMGQIWIGDKLYEAESIDDFIEKGSKVIVTDVSSYKIYVQKSNLGEEKIQQSIKNR